MSKIVLFNKPYDVLCQFTDEQGRKTLADYVPITHIYPAGRLDRDSEGLLVLTDDGHIQHQLTDPRHKLAKTYWVQVEGMPTPQALQQLRQGVMLKDGLTRPATVQHLSEEPALWSRHPPIRQRQHIPTSWLSLTISEGRNRQIRRMTAHVGLPTLRLIRVQIGEWSLQTLLPGQWQRIDY